MWVIISIVVGSAVGVLSYRHQKVFLGFMAATLPLSLFISIRLIGPFFLLFGDLPSKLPQHETGEHTVWTAIFDLVFSGREIAILCFPVFLILGRIVSWFLEVGVAKPEIIETRDERKRRIRLEFGDNVF